MTQAGVGELHCRTSDRGEEESAAHWKLAVSYAMEIYRRYLDGPEEVGRRRDGQGRGVGGVGRTVPWGAGPM